MPVPLAVTRWNKHVVNPVLRHLVGLGPFAELEHVGRRSGRTYRVPLMAFRSDTARSDTARAAARADAPDESRDVVTIALTYGPEVDWLRNLRTAGGGRLRLGPSVLTLGAPRPLTEAEGLSRMPFPPRLILPVAGCHDFVELPVLGEVSTRKDSRP